MCSGLGSVGREVVAERLEVPVVDNYTMLGCCFCRLGPFVGARAVVVGFEVAYKAAAAAAAAAAVVVEPIVGFAVGSHMGCY